MVGNLWPERSVTDLQIIVFPGRTQPFCQLKEQGAFMKIAYYMPFKPLGHHNPSGDLVIGTELFAFLAQQHEISLATTLRCRWVYLRPSLMLKLFCERRRILRQQRPAPPDIWLTYHTYYKAPDLIGPYVAARLGIPYVIFQGIFSTKRRRELKTLPGYYLNRRTLLQADHIFTNKRRDHINLQRLIPNSNLSYIAPGIQPELFQYSPSARESLRNEMHTGEDTIIMTTAMMRPGVKTTGIRLVLKACSTLHQRGHRIKLLIVGDGENRQVLEAEARELLQDRVVFAGRVQRESLFRYYSSADIFVFPGIEESLGMVYLEAQSCRLPVVAYQDWGGAEAVVHNATGLLSPAAQPELLTTNLQELLTSPELRLRLGRQAEAHVHNNHDVAKNYQRLLQVLTTLTR